ncbi:unnamed protein product [Rotaria magnacalcarata]|uniref:Uncharacterized protein n=1 Tax=Rotaria magnacalcarata TaxID=392030 RepID=A0A820FVN4_9BILA|nr:unnamed protein product [Rotaria magnacalcarata]CAF4285894.1 unnamed protein product [Rotaria magnacalcarata]
MYQLKFILSSKQQCIIQNLNIHQTTLFKRFINQTKRLMVNSNVELTRLYDQKFKRSDLYIHPIENVSLAIDTFIQSKMSDLQFKRFINQTLRLKVYAFILWKMSDLLFKRSVNHTLGSRIYTFILLKYMSCNLEVHHITRYE